MPWGAFGAPKASALGEKRENSTNLPLPRDGPGDRENRVTFYVNTPN